MNAEMQEELLMLLRGQQRELTELRGQIEAMQSTIMSQVEHALNSHHELERILDLLDTFQNDDGDDCRFSILSSTNILKAVWTTHGIISNH